jgi:negative regulator of replication initiation
VRTTITLDDDVAALIESERARTGESFRDVVNRLLRRAGRREPQSEAPELPTLAGRPVIDISDASAVLAALDDERRAQRGVA